MAVPEMVGSEEFAGAKPLMSTVCAEVASIEA
jgi:hypothetical protein